LVEDAIAEPLTDADRNQQNRRAADEQ